MIWPEFHLDHSLKPQWLFKIVLPPAVPDGRARDHRDRCRRQLTSV